jgi:hypothetical protein
MVKKQLVVYWTGSTTLSKAGNNSGQSFVPQNQQDQDIGVIHEGTFFGTPDVENVSHESQGLSKKRKIRK